MCNLSQGVEERGIEKGLAEAVLRIYKKGYSIEQISDLLDMNIEKYVTVNFNALVDVIDAVGGLDLELTHDEVVHMNNYCVETSKVTGKKYKKIEPAVAGTYKLNGVQAVSYARIRYTAGGDYKRTERQRLVLKKTADKLKQQDLATLNKIIDKVMPEVSTSFTTKEILSLATGAFDYELGETTGFPFDLETPEQIPGYSGSYVIPKGLEENVIKLHQFLYPNKDYTPTATVTDISNTLNDMTKVYPNTTESGTSQNE